MTKGLEIRRIELWSLFKVAFLIYLALGLLLGLIYGLFMMAIGGVGATFMGEDFPGVGFLGGALSLLAAPFLACLYAVVGSVFVTLAGLVFNGVAKLTGGVRLGIVAEGADSAASVDPEKARP